VTVSMSLLSKRANGSGWETFKHFLAQSEIHGKVWVGVVVEKSPLCPFIDLLLISLDVEALIDASVQQKTKMIIDRTRMWSTGEVAPCHEYGSDTSDDSEMEKVATASVLLRFKTYFSEPTSAVRSRLPSG